MDGEERQLKRPTAPARKGLPRTYKTDSAEAASGAEEAAENATPSATVEPPVRATRTRTGLPSRAVAAEVVPAAPDIVEEKPIAAEEDIPVAEGIAVSAPEARSSSAKIYRFALRLIALLTLVLAAVLGARWLLTLAFIQDLLVTYPGELDLPDGAPVGLPGWLGWQHFFNMFFIVLIIRSGWQVRTQRKPPAMWTRNNTRLIRTKNPPKKISLTLWFHFTLDVLWVVNGAVFVVLLFTTGQWMRVVPTSWEVFPNALSAALQYVSLDWPTENGWVNYNSLQVLAYCVTIFVAAPLAAVTGARMSGAWPSKADRLNRVYPMELARAVHFPVMLYFVGFIIVHVALVLATGALRNLNHMYASQDAVNWTGFWIFVASIVVIVGAAVAARPVVLAPIAQLLGKVGR